MCRVLNQKSFYNKFKDEEKCLEFLFKEKWGKGFRCRRCGSSSFWKGRTKFHARCNNCGYDESVTANTAFHNLQFSISQAFFIMFHVTAVKKGSSCRSLSKLSGLGLKTVWLFKRKLQKVMGIDVAEEFGNMEAGKSSSIDGILLSNRNGGLNGLQQVKLRIYKFSTSSKIGLIRLRISEFNSEYMLPCSLVEGRYTNEGKDVLIWNLRAWLTGTHHHCSAEYLQGYLDEYCFRFNNRDKEDLIWQRLVTRMINTNPNTIKGNAAAI